MFFQDARCNAVRVGDTIAYAVREGSCSTALRFAVVEEIEQLVDQINIKARRTDSGSLVTLHHPERIVLSR